MTNFEKLADELNVKIETNRNGLYNGMCEVLASICTDIILSDDETIFNLSWDKQKEIIKENFYRIFPYKKERKTKWRLKL